MDTCLPFSFYTVAGGYVVSWIRFIITLWVKDDPKEAVEPLPPRLYFEIVEPPLYPSGKQLHFDFLDGNFNKCMRNGSGFAFPGVVSELTKMFYNQVILTKKGVLGKVWLAAHWERKLTKAQVFETNIQSSVNDILHPKVKLALRTSGHLLLGVVRIYSKKAKYLLSDCNEVLAKLKLAFRPTTSIDLPKSQQEARREAITLQRKSKLPMLDLEATSQSFQRDLHLDDMSEDELSERLSVARASRVEDITLKDDILAASRSDVSRPDDTFGDVDFEDLDLGADEQDIDIDLSSTHGGRRQEQVDADFDDDLLAPVAAPEVDIDMPPPPEPENIIDDDGMDNAIDNEAHGPAGDISMLNIEGFALPPLDLSTTANNKLSRRRRKLIVDEFKNLTGEQIKQQLNDPSDLVGGLDLAPPSTTIMQLREAERSEKTAMTTATYYEANYICEELTRNLHFRISAPPVARLEEFCDFLGIDMSRSETTQTSEGNQLCFYFADCAPNLCSEFDNFVSQYETDRANQAAALRELEDHAVLSNDAGPMPAAGAPSSQEAPASPAAPIPMARDLTPDRGLLPGVAADVSMPAPLAPNVSAGFDVSGAAPNIDLLPLDDIGAVASPSGKRSRSPAGGAKSSKKRKTQALEEVAEDAEEGEDGQKADDDLRMNPKTRQLFKTIQRNVQKRQQKAEPAAAVDANGKKKKIKAFVMFDELLANQKSRKEVARRFYSLLVMTKLQAVRVQQKRPYADIKITAGAKFNKF